MLIKPIPEKLTKAKSRLVLRQAFFATILLGLELEEKADLQPPTMATNGLSIFYHPKYVEDLSVENLVAELAHECMHVAMLHPWRIGARQKKKANLAADCAIDCHIEAAGLELPQWVLEQRKGLKQYDWKSMEEIYHLMPDQPDGGGGKQGGKPGPGESRDNVMQAPGQESDRQQSEAEAKVKIQQAANAAKAQGQLPASLAKLVEEILEPKVDWPNELRKYFSALAKADQSWAKKQKRFQDIYLPSFHSYQLGPVVIGMDTSGSVWEEAPAFLGECTSICEECKPEKITLIQCDARVTDVKEYEAGEPITAEAKGGGGTDLRHIFNKIDKMDEEPAIVVILTDLETPFPKEAPSYPVLWVSTVKHPVPFGDVIYL